MWFDKLIEILQYAWPFRRVDPWERGNFYVWGRVWRRWPADASGTVPAGVYFVIPWFSDVLTVTTTPAIVTSARQDIELKDGSTLSFAVSAWTRVTDSALALNSVDQYQETTFESIISVVSAKLAEVDAERLAPEKRGRLLADLVRWVNEETEPFGVRVEKLRFVNFIRNVNTIRLLQDSQIVGTW